MGEQEEIEIGKRIFLKGLFMGVLWGVTLFAVIQFIVAIVMEVLRYG